MRKSAVKKIKKATRNRVSIPGIERIQSLPVGTAENPARRLMRRFKKCWNRMSHVDRAKWIGGVEVGDPEGGEG